MYKCLLASLSLTLLLNNLAAADGQADARAILDKAIAAHGGEAALSKIVASRVKLKGTSYDGTEKSPLSPEWTAQGLDKMRAVSFDDKGNPDTIEVVNGKEGWIKEAGHDTDAMSEAQLKSRGEMIYVDWITWLAPLKGQEYKLSPLPEKTIADRKAVGILVHHGKHDDIKLYFDRESHILVSYERRFDNVDAGTVVDEHTIYSDYRTVHGTKQPFKMETYWGGVMSSEATATSFELFDKPLDDKLFAKP
jgi:hypothetical protein